MFGGQAMSGDNLGVSALRAMHEQGRQQGALQARREASTWLQEQLEDAKWRGALIGATLGFAAGAGLVGFVWLCLA